MAVGVSATTVGLEGGHRIPALQVLRGGVATMVVAVHCIACWVPVMKSNALSSSIADGLLIFISGRAPVILFFVLSGYVLAESLDRNRHKDPTVAFYVQRCLRIVPAAYVGLVAMLGAAAVGKNAIPEGRLPLTDFLVNSMANAVVPHLWAGALFWDNRINPAYWTLHVEVVGSALMPLFYAIVVRQHGGTRLIVASLLVVVTALLPFVPYRISPLSQMTSMLVFCFALGVLASVLVRRGHSLLSSKILAAAAAATLLFAHGLIGPKSSLGVILGDASSLTSIMGMDGNIALFLQHLTEAAAATILVAFVSSTRSNGLLSRSAVTRFLGEISYSLYIIHLPVLIVVMAAIWHASPTTVLDGCPILPFVAFVLVMSGSIALSIPMYYYVERPGMPLGRNLTRRMGAMPAA